jgi:hypothetical protein
MGFSDCGGLNRHGRDKFGRLSVEMIIPHGSDAIGLPNRRFHEALNYRLHTIRVWDDLSDLVIRRVNAKGFDHFIDVVVRETYRPKKLRLPTSLNVLEVEKIVFDFVSLDPEEMGVRHPGFNLHGFRTAH